MWAYYAASYSGICVGMRIDSRIGVAGKHAVIANDGSHLMDVIYNDQAIMVDWDDYESSSRALYTKHTDWQHEREVRLLAKIEADRPGRTIVLNRSLIRELILGHNCSEEDSIKAVEAVADLDVDIYRIDIAHGKIDRKRI